VRIRWDADNDQFLYRLHNRPEVAISYAGSSDSAPPSSYFKRIEHRTQPHNCDVSDGAPEQPPIGLGEVRIFDVKVNEEALP
jgi:hypothetical protein